METDTFFRSYKNYNAIKNKFIYKIKPSNIFNFHPQCGKRSCKNMQVLNVFNGGIKTMQCMSHSLQNKLQDNAESSDTCISKCLQWGNCFAILG